MAKAIKYLSDWRLFVSEVKTQTLYCRVTELVDVSDFDSDDESLGGSSPSSVAIMPHIPSYGGEEGKEGGVWDRAHKSAPIEAITSVRRKIATFLRVFR